MGNLTDITSNEFLKQLKASRHNPTFKGLRFTEASSLSNSSHKSLIFQGCIFLKDMVFNLREGNGEIIFSQCEFRGKIKFVGSNHDNPGSINIFHCAMFPDIIIKGNYQSININSDCLNLALVNCTAGSLTIGTFGKVVFYTNFLVIENVSIRRIKLAHLNVRHIIFEANIAKENELSIENIQCQYFNIAKTNNEGRLRIFNLTPFDKIEPFFKNEFVAHSFFSIEKSNLGKAELFNIELQKFRKVVIAQSVLSDCVVVNINWPKRIHTSQSWNKNFQEEREIYRQLKYVLSKQGSTIQEHYFHMKELNSYYKGLSYKKDLWTKLVIGLSWATSNYGQSILRPILFLLLFNGLLFWWLYLLESSWYEPITYAINTGEKGNVIGVFINYLNPLHKFDDSLKGYQVLADSLMRVVSSYSIYNFIRASRRFIK